MTAFRFFLALLATLGVAGPAIVHAQSDKTHLDDFAVDAGEAGLGIQQLSEKGRPQAGPVPNEVDRQVAVPGPPPVNRQPIEQLSTRGGVEPSAQLSGKLDSNNVVSQRISSPGDSRPQALARINGKDRCDPEQAPEQLAECQRILELRAAEFDAPEAPKLSAEQVLLVERGENYEVLASTDADLRTKIAGRPDPDAQSPANQELASIYLDPAPSVHGGVAGTEQSPAEGITELVAGLLGLQSQGAK